MASSVNNIAATFSTITKKPSSATSSTSSPPKKTPLSVSSASWNPHTSIPKSQRLSLLRLYGHPGPPRSSTAVRKIQPIATARFSPTVDAGRRVPNVKMSFLNRNDAVQTVTLPSLCKGKRVVLVVGVSAAFSPACSKFVKGVVESGTARKWWDLVACVAVNDVFVMRAWGEHLGVGEDVVMPSDDGGDLAGALGVSLSAGEGCLGGLRPRRFCVKVVNGVINGVDFDDEF